MEVDLPRCWKHRINRITGLVFCDKKCGCGESNELWWFPSCGNEPRKWIPSWMNGADSHDVWRWLVENGKVGLRKKPVTRLKSSTQVSRSQ